jgi:hypothetical protein
MHEKMSRSGRGTVGIPSCMIIEKGRPRHRAWSRLAGPAVLEDCRDRALIAVGRPDSHCPAEPDSVGLGCGAGDGKRSRMAGLEDMETGPDTFSAREVSVPGVAWGNPSSPGLMARGWPEAVLPPARRDISCLRSGLTARPSVRIGVQRG